jgi:hypothetical protein
MDRGGDGCWDPLGVEDLTAMLRDLEGSAEDGLGGRRAQTDEHLRLHDRQFCVEPWPARGDVRHRRLAMDTSLPARFPTEVLDRVGDVDLVAIEPSLGEASIEELPGWTDERMALEVLTVTRLLTYDHHPSRGGALAEHGLRAEVVKVAPGADLGCTLEHLEAEPRWEEGLRGWVLVGHVSFVPGGAGPQHSSRDPCGSRRCPRGLGDVVATGTAASLRLRPSTGRLRVDGVHGGNILMDGITGCW